jgi:hypothetical protein
MKCSMTLSTKMCLAPPVLRPWCVWRQVCGLAKRVTRIYHHTKSLQKTSLAQVKKLRAVKTTKISHNMEKESAFKYRAISRFFSTRDQKTRLAVLLRSQPGSVDEIRPYLNRGIERIDAV